MSDTGASFLSGGGELGERCRTYDWAASPLGPLEAWPQSLRSAVSILLPSKAQIILFWGPQFVCIYNDAYRPIFGIGARHPRALGKPGAEAWDVIWHRLGPLLEGVVATGEAFSAPDFPYFVDRGGFLEEVYFDVSYDPVRDETGNVGGVFCIVSETTQRVVGERRLRTLRDLATEAATVRESIEDACRSCIPPLEANPRDVPFAIVYVADGDVWSLGAATRGPLALLDAAGLFDPALWPLRSVSESCAPYILSGLALPALQLEGLPPECTPTQAVAVPVRTSDLGRAHGLLVVGVSAVLALDEGYRGFFGLIARHVASAIANATAHLEEKKRIEALAEIDRAKTAFFSNVSHEFRTPLTLMLGPLEDLISSADGDSPATHRQLAVVAHRNALRLHKLVNTLLDFSRIEGGRIQASYEASDLAVVTADLAGVFRSAIERAGLTLIVDCPPLPEPVYIDREMWEKIVLNLLSNAFKFTFAGTIEVALRWCGDHVELRVRDTGVGISAAELPRIFDRFHRIRDVRARTHEGTGIGLALVLDLVRLHGGSVAVESTEEEGSTFTVAVKTGTAHLPQERIRAARTLASTTIGAAPFVQEAVQWLPGGVPTARHGLTDDDGFVSALQAVDPPRVVPDTDVRRPRVLWADDNADMRDYVTRLLSPLYEIEAVADGVSAIAAAERQTPDLVLADVMMPGLDGFGLLRALRADPLTGHVPIILLSARAGEESRVEGLQQGADDYLIKPFNARELLARVSGRLELARLRQRMEIRLRESEERFRLATSAGHVGVWDWNIANNTVSWSDSVYDIHGIEPGAFAGTRAAFTELIHVDDRRQVDEAVHRALHEDVPYDLEFRAVRPGGDVVWIYTHANVLRDATGSPVRMVGAMVDITRRKHVEDELRNANRVKDEFLATLSHELRTPLNAMLGWARLLGTGTLHPDLAKQAVATLERSAKAQTQLVDDLLDMSRIISGKLQIQTDLVALPSVIAGAMATVRPAAIGKGISLDGPLPPAPHLHVNGDADRLQQIVWNLLSNAIKFTPRGGSVAVTLRQVDGAAEINVCDSGEGIGHDFLPFVFDRFRQADGSTTRRHGGLGLGLAIVRHLTEAHGGTVVAHSDGAHRGATFTVRLPLGVAAGENAEKRRPEYSRSTDVLADRKILVVDDEADARELLTVVLQMHGARVTAVSSAAEAMTRLEREAFDVLLGDIAMPGQDGFSLIKAVRVSGTANARVPAIAVTAYASVNERERALEAGYHGHLAKPIEPERLVAAIVAAVAKQTPSRISPPTSTSDWGQR